MAMREIDTKLGSLPPNANMILSVVSVEFTGTLKLVSETKWYILLAFSVHHTFGRLCLVHFLLYMLQYK